MIQFAGRDWRIKDEGYIKRGAGPNYWARENVWVDDQGKLHLHAKWNPLYACWECAQVESLESMGYGTYEWKVEGFPSRMDAQWILGLYTYDTLAISEDFREIDIEVGRWGDPKNLNSQYVVRPATPLEDNSHKDRFNTRQSGSYMTYSFTWMEGAIVFKTWYGHDTSRAPVHEWVYRNDRVPTEGSETARMNLWLFRGKEPANQQQQEIIIKDFTFTPRI